jgi:hypothetical protein
VPIYYFSNFNKPEGSTKRYDSIYSLSHLAYDFILWKKKKQAIGESEYEVASYALNFAA